MPIARTLLTVLLLFLSCCDVIAQISDSTSVPLSKQLRAQFDKLPIDFSTSLELKYGLRTATAPVDRPAAILGESRLQLDAAYYADWSEMKGKIDLGYDGVQRAPLVDLRELYVEVYPHSWWSAKVGRQALTWGKGDLVFINDLFPKDYQSFFSGRDIQYLKAPSDAFKLTLSPSWLQINIVYTPQFDPDRFPTGERIVFFDQFYQSYRVPDNQLPFNLPSQWLSDDELAWRLQKNVGGWDLALYGYSGFWKGPNGFDTSISQYSFPSLQVYGLSADGSVLGGIVAVEAGYYASTDDDSGEDPFVRNSEYRWLISYGLDLPKSLSLSLQYYSEIMTDYDEYIATLPDGIWILPQRQDMLSIRARKLASKQRLELSLFAFFGIANTELYLRPRVAYKINDYWKVDIGANIFAGSDDLTFLNQFRYNNNLYFGIKWAI